MGVLRERVAALEAESARLADVVAQAAELMVELEEARERERELRLVQHAVVQLQCVHSSREQLLVEAAEALVLVSCLGLGPGWAARLRDEPVRGSEASHPSGPAVVREALDSVPDGLRAGGGVVVLPLRAGDDVLGAIAFEGRPDPVWLARWSESLLVLGAQLGTMVARIEDAECLVKLNGELERRTADAWAANQAKGLFLANMSHELRTPLNAVIGYAELVQEMGVDGVVTCSTSELDNIVVAGRHLLGLVDDVLDLSRIEADRVDLLFEVFEVGALVRSIAELLHPRLRDRHNSLCLDLQPDLRVWTDAARLRQIVLNLAGNAAKFTAGGTVTLSTRLRAGSDGPELELQVRDTGIGIAPEVQERLFRPFSQADASTTRQFGGSGLGLAITRGLCHLLGGTVTIASAPGSGSTFTVLLPVAVGGRSAEADGHLLLVSEDDGVLALVRRFLTDRGWRVSEARGGGVEEIDVQDGRLRAVVVHPRSVDPSGEAGPGEIVAGVPPGVPIVVVVLGERRRSGGGAALEAGPRTGEPEVPLATVLSQLDLALRRVRDSSDAEFLPLLGPRRPHGG